MSYDYDHLVLGGGSAGYAAARTAHELGLKTAVVDGAETLGGLCILRGCMPSKTLIESSNRMRSMRRSKEFGLWANDFGFDAGAINDRKRKLIDEFASYRQEQLTDGRFDLIRGTAEFIDEHTVRVGGEKEITFATALIATGSVITRIPIDGLEETGYWTSRDVLDAREYPDSIVVLGGGAIALEMACFFEGLGIEVTVIQRSAQVLSGSDRDVADAVEKAMSEADNCTVYTGTKLLRVEESDAGKTVCFEHDGEEKSVTAGEILQALGRSPNTAGLGLEAAGIETQSDGKKVKVNSEMATSQPHVFAAGDVCGPYEIVHIAIEQGEISAQNAAVFLDQASAESKREIDYRLKLLGIFTHPEVATVGLSEEEAEKEGRKVIVDSYPFDDHGKSMVKGETHGFVKLIADAETNELVGGAVVGPDAVDLIHEIAVAMHFNATAADLAKVPHYHPTLSEIWTYPAEELAEQAEDANE
ncbi:MAG: NAD(P)/FAD-dependent oxidoreductase [Verrucomicrobiales bacterium]|nr:NAD(P)/FAD-dependent oxidoreductase [Verrucomicrobiales bacterium]